MAKEDVADIPSDPPKKARQLAQVPDIWLAVWATDVKLAPSKRRRAREERDRRKALVPDRRVGVITDLAGLTPEQFRSLADLLPSMGVTEVHRQERVPSKLHYIMRGLDVPLVLHRYDQEIVKGSDVVIALPKETYEPLKKEAGVWHWIKYAKHRNTPVKIIRPNGEVT